MKKIRWGLVLALTAVISVAFADIAPVESISTEDTQQMSNADEQASNVQNNAAIPAASSAPSNSYDTDNTNQDQTQPDANTPMNRDITDRARLARLEQQMSNMTQMNLPQQIDELRQEIQQLNGQLQVQRHDVQVLSNQQRSFYQDLNRRVQQLIGSGNVSPASERAASQEKANTAVADARMGDSNAYRAAFDLLVKKQYPDAIQRFKAYIDNYPKGAFIANTYYWLGEIYLKKGDTVNAQKSFDTVVSRYSKSNKVPDAKLKLAIIRVNLGEKEEGRRQLKAIKREYPGSTAAQLASIQLQRMQ